MESHQKEEVTQTGGRVIGPLSFAFLTVSLMKGGGIAMSKKIGGYIIFLAGTLISAAGQLIIQNQKLSEKTATSNGSEEESKGE